ncbi:hypothetical protein [Silvanigrella aquatica]|uniref:Uncharacterized protein n=1 Tax=Silvanigrella aquatica TaxID=1915309 RepID=A0A1L4D3Q5_9BACT|nr:hypothetical protein [Silvanigrella aquatica]APJ04807.1 hypothetical protein AXG55_13230 [Silvanigrella aquatica]
MNKIIKSCITSLVLLNFGNAFSQNLNLSIENECREQSIGEHQRLNAIRINNYTPDRLTQLCYSLRTTSPSQYNIIDYYDITLINLLTRIREIEIQSNNQNTNLLKCFNMEHLKIKLAKAVFTERNGSEASFRSKINITNRKIESNCQNMFRSGHQ